MELSKGVALGKCAVGPQLPLSIDWTARHVELPMMLGPLPLVGGKRVVGREEVEVVDARGGLVPRLLVAPEVMHSQLLRDAGGESVSQSVSQSVSSDAPVAPAKSHGVSQSVSHSVSRSVVMRP